MDTKEITHKEKDELLASQDEFWGIVNEPLATQPSDGVIVAVPTSEGSEQERQGLSTVTPYVYVLMSIKTSSIQTPMSLDQWLNTIKANEGNFNREA